MIADGTQPRTFVYLQRTGDDERDQAMLDGLRKYLGEHPDVLPIQPFVFDTAESADKRLSNRPRGRIMSGELRRGDRLIVHSMDQLGRSTYDGISVCHDLAFRRNITVIALEFAGTMSLDSSTNQGKGWLAMSLHIAESQRLSIGMATKLGLDKRRNHGLPMSRPEYGWRIEGTGDERRLVEVPHEQEMRRRIWDWNQKGLGAMRIASLLNLAAWATADREVRGRVLFRGRTPWRRQTITKMITRMREERQQVS